MFTYTTKVRHTLGDLHTPVSLYLRVRDLYPQSALMECSDFHSHDNSRSFIALNPIASVSVSHAVATCRYPDGSSTSRTVADGGGVSQEVERFMARFDISGPESGCCGLYGYTSFNAVSLFDQIPVKDDTHATDDAPDILYILYKYVIAFDHFSGQLSLIELLEDGEPDTLDALSRTLSSQCQTTYPFRATGPCTSPLTDDDHRANIRRGIAHCLRGDVFQIVLSRRFIQPYEGDDFQLYRALRSVNPSPYLFYFDFGGFRIFGSSPETHCRISAGKAYIDPIAGTTRRTGDPAADTRAAEALRADPKENAEHVMLVDLARNDLSRNCHSVSVDFYKELQQYSHVIHLVSRVSGTLDSEARPVRTFFDTFPAGTLSGAPKVRAMQIISELEPHNRGAYGGCIGFIGFDGSLNQAITIRTFVSRAGELWMQAGGGIVAKSDVEHELQEVNNKLGALRAAIEAAGDPLRQVDK